MKKSPLTKNYKENNDRSRFSDERVREIRVAYMRKHNEVSSILFSPSNGIIDSPSTPLHRSRNTAVTSITKYSDKKEDDVEMIEDENEANITEELPPKVAWNFWKTIGLISTPETSPNRVSKNNVLESIKLEKVGEEWKYRDDEGTDEENEDKEESNGEISVSSATSVEFHTPMSHIDRLENLNTSGSTTWRFSGYDYDDIGSDGSSSPSDDDLDLGNTSLNCVDVERERGELDVDNRSQQSRLITSQLDGPLKSKPAISLSLPNSPPGPQSLVLTPHDTSPSSSSSKTDKDNHNKRITEKEESKQFVSKLLENAVEDVSFILGMEEYMSKEEGGDIDLKRKQEETDREKMRAWREMEMENDAFFVKGFQKIGENLEEQLRLLRSKDS
jgi:hypothetical protein